MLDHSQPNLPAPDESRSDQSQSDESPLGESPTSPSSHEPAQAGVSGGAAVRNAEAQWRQMQGPPIFELGQVLATSGALEALRDALTEPLALLNRHQSGDWGDLDTHDHEANQQALVDGTRLLSAYTLPETGERVWIITEWDRSVTTLLLPNEY